VHAWRWICGVKPTPKAVNKPSPHCIVHGLDKPGGFTTVSKNKKDLLAWWLFKGYPVSQLDRSVLCLYAREQWQHWGAQVHREPCYPWLRAFCEQRAAALPSAAHWEALVRASCAVCVEAQRPMVTQGYGNGKAPAHLSTYGQAMPWGGGL